MNPPVYGEPAPHRIEVGIEFYGDPQRGRIVIEDALDLLMDRLIAHPTLTDASIETTFLPSARSEVTP